jgi:hypothetical protein
VRLNFGTAPRGSAPNLGRIHSRRVRLLKADLPETGKSILIFEPAPDAV